MPIPFPAQAPTGGHIIGQPFSIAKLSLPVNCEFTCNCVPGNQPMPVIASAPVKCEVCAKTYAVAFNPSNGQLMIVQVVEEAKEPS